MNLVEGGFAYGMDLDGGQPACRHADFTGPQGEPGIDNQLYRLLGCIHGYQPNEAAETYRMNAYKVGERTTLIEVTGLDAATQEGRKNDPEVPVAVMLGPLPRSWLRYCALSATRSYYDTEKFFEQISMPGTRDGSVKGGATNFGYSCPGLWYALQRLADGTPDANGKCTSISTAFRVEAMAAFVIHGEARTAEAAK